MEANLAALLIVMAPVSIDPNLATLVGLVVTSLITATTTIILAIINWKKSSELKVQSTSIEQKVDAGNAMTGNVQTTVNGNTAALQKQVADAHAEIARLNRAMPPEKP